MVTLIISSQIVCNKTIFTNQLYWYLSVLISESYLTCGKSMYCGIIRQLKRKMRFYRMTCYIYKSLIAGSKIYISFAWKRLLWPNYKISRSDYLPSSSLLVQQPNHEELSEKKHVLLGWNKGSFVFYAHNKIVILSSVGGKVINNALSWYIC